MHGVSDAHRIQSKHCTQEKLLLISSKQDLYSRSDAGQLSSDRNHTGCVLICNPQQLSRAYSQCTFLSVSFKMSIDSPAGRHFTLSV